MRRLRPLLVTVVAALAIAALNQVAHAEGYAYGASAGVGVCCSAVPAVDALRLAPSFKNDAPVDTNVGGTDAHAGSFIHVGAGLERSASRLATGAGTCRSSVVVSVATNTFEPSPKHDQTRPGIGAQPTNGQSALDRSVQVSDTSSRRVGVDAGSGEIVVFDETYPGQCIFHGHVRTCRLLSA